MRFSSQPTVDHPIHTPLLLPKVLHKQIHQLVDPIAADQDTADDVDDPDEEPEERRAVLGNHKTQRLDVVLEEYARDTVVGDRPARLRDGVLVREEAPAVGLRVILCGNDGEEVLKLEEVLLGGGGDIVEGIDQFRVQFAEAEFVDDMREVEGVVIDVVADGLVAVTFGGDVEVAANAVNIHTPVDPAAAAVLPSEPRGGSPFALAEL